MSPHHVGATTSYRDIAIQAVTSAHHQKPSPAYGYLRAGFHQKVYLFNALDDARAWHDQERANQHVALEPVYDYTAVFDAANLSTPVAEDFGGGAVVSGAAQVGADTIEHYRNTAAHAVTGTHHQNPSPLYGYLRLGVHQKIYLFPLEQDARAWFDQRDHVESGYDYAAVFAATNLHTPIVEDLGISAAVSGDPEQVGHWLLPIALGLPAGAAGGYFYRKWQEEHPGQIIPGISGEVGYDASVGGPWVDIVGADLDKETNDRFWAQTGYKPGQPLDPRNPTDVSMIHVWLDIHDKLKRDADAGKFVTKYDHLAAATAASSTDDVARRRAYPRTKALIQSAIREALTSDVGVKREAAAMPIGPMPTHYVWKLVAGPEEIGGPPFYANMNFFHSRDEALNYARHLNQNAGIVATAVFDTTSPHWPNPVAWHKSDDPSHEWVIAEQIAKHAPPQMAGEIVGAGPWHTIVGAALDVLRRQAKVAAEEMPGRVIGVLRGATNQWQLKSFRTLDDADDWFGRATVEPRDFTYAAYFEKDTNGIPFIENEAIGGARTPSSAPGSSIRREIATVTVSP